MSDVLFGERATRLELASRHPTNGLRPFAGTLPLLRHSMCALRTGGGSEFGGCRKRKRTSNLDVLFWSGLRGSNSLPPPWQGGALPDELSPRNRTYLNRRSCFCQASFLVFLKIYSAAFGAISSSPVRTSVFSFSGVSPASSASSPPSSFSSGRRSSSSGGKGR